MVQITASLQPLVDRHLADLEALATKKSIIETHHGVSQFEIRMPLLYSQRMRRITR